MKYLLMITMNPEVMGSLSEEEQNAIFAGHDAFQKEIVRPGELLSSVALADPSNTKTVRVRDDVPAVTDGPYIEAKEFLAGYYLVECETRATRPILRTCRRARVRRREPSCRATGAPG
jgi:hypothetical protein